jgi:hypothetical protein
MSRKIILPGALILLLAVILFMAWDLFLNKPSGVNPYAYDLKSFKAGDTSLIMYSEVQHFIPNIPLMHGIAVDHTDRLFICGEKCVEIYDRAGQMENKFSFEGTATCILVDSAGRIFLGIQDHIEIYDCNGNLLRKWQGFGANAIITSIGVSGKDVFIADAGNKIVYHCDLSGIIQNKIGEKDPEKGIPGFVVPSPYFDLAVDNKRHLWVVNPGRHRFEKYNFDGGLICFWGESSMLMEGFCGCCNPSNFAFLSDGSFVTTEKGLERIKVYWPDGTFRHIVAGPDAFIEGTRGLDVAVDSKNRILVLDPEKKQVRIFEKKKQ